MIKIIILFIFSLSFYSCQKTKKEDVTVNQIKKNEFIIDTKTFTILASYAVNYENNAEVKMPFYTRVEEIEDTIFHWSFFDFFSGKKNLSYNDYYKRILGIN